MSARDHYQNLCGEWSFTAPAALICDHPNQVISLHTQLFAQLWGCRGEGPCSVGKPSNCPFMGFRCWSTTSIFSRCRDAGVLRNWVHCAYHWQIASCMPMFKLRSGLSICGYEDKLYIQYAENRFYGWGQVYGDSSARSTFSISWPGKEEPGRHPRQLYLLWPLETFNVLPDHWPWTLPSSWEGFYQLTESRENKDTKVCSSHS